MRARLREGDIPARKAWIRALIDRIEAVVRICYRKEVLEQAVAGGEIYRQGFAHAFRSGAPERI